MRSVWNFEFQCQGAEQWPVHARWALACVHAGWLMVGKVWTRLKWPKKCQSAFFNFLIWATKTEICVKKCFSPIMPPDLMYCHNACATESNLGGFSCVCWYKFTLWSVMASNRKWHPIELWIGFFSLTLLMGGDFLNWHTNNFSWFF